VPRQLAGIESFQFLDKCLSQAWHSSNSCW